MPWLNQYTTTDHERAKGYAKSFRKRGSGRRVRIVKRTSNGNPRLGLGEKGAPYYVVQSTPERHIGWND